MIHTCTIPSDALTADPGELAARLHVRRDVYVEGLDEILAELKNVLYCRYCWERVPIQRPAPNHLDLGFGSFESRDLTKNLTGCREAFLFAVTSGIGVDRYLMRLSRLSGARHFIADAAASALAEAACDQADREIKGMHSCPPRFSPGYGDLPLGIQPALLQALQAQKLLGITLTERLLMVPTKSITAIMGILHENEHS